MECKSVATKNDVAVLQFRTIFAILKILIYLPQNLLVIFSFTRCNKTNNEQTIKLFWCNPFTSNQNPAQKT